MPLATHKKEWYTGDKSKKEACAMYLPALLALSPLTGDDSPTTRLVVLLILGLAVAAAIVLCVTNKKK